MGGRIPPGKYQQGRFSVCHVRTGAAFDAGNLQASDTGQQLTGFSRALSPTSPDRRERAFCRFFYAFNCRRGKHIRAQGTLVVQRIVQMRVVLKQGFESHDRTVWNMSRLFNRRNSTLPWIGALLRYRSPSLQKTRLLKGCTDCLTQVPPSELHDGLHRLPPKKNQGRL